MGWKVGLGRGLSLGLEGRALKKVAVVDELEKSEDVGLVHVTSQVVNENGDVMNVGERDGSLVHDFIDSIFDPLVALGVADGVAGVVDELETVLGQVFTVIKSVLSYWDILPA